MLVDIYPPKRFLFNQIQESKHETCFLSCSMCSYSKKKKNKDKKRKATDEDAKPDIVGMFIQRKLLTFLILLI